MNPILWAVDRNGWWFVGKKPIAKNLVEIWESDKASDVMLRVPGRREIRA